MIYARLSFSRPLTMRLWTWPFTTVSKLAKRRLKHICNGSMSLLQKPNNLRALVIQAASLHKAFETPEEPAEILTPYVSAFRYPGGSNEPMPSREEFDEALRHARTMYDFVLNLLPAEARP
jgi:hypothetical protein